MQELIIETIGQYHVQRLLARGGMAKVYLAQDIQTGKQVAIKLVHSSAVEYSERFQFEAETLAKLSHRHILPIIEYGECESWHYLVTPYISGGTLNQRLKKGPLSCEQAGQILDQLAHALQFTHEQGLVHRDIKPSNILMRDEHFIYLADFGLAKYIDEIGGLTLRDYILGTPEYMAPEELAEDKATPLSDLYSLGILLYQMVTGKLPFTANNAINVCIKHLHDFPPIPSSFNANISQTVESVILRALEKDPQRRFQTVREFSQAYWQALQKDQYAQMMAVTQLIPILKVPQVNVYKMRQSPRRRTLASTMLALTVLASVPIIFGLSALSHGPLPSPVQAQQVLRPPHATVLLSKPTPIPTSTPVHPAVMMESSLNRPNVQNNTLPVSTGGSEPPVDNQQSRDQSRQDNRHHHDNHNNAFPDLPGGDPFANGNGFPSLPGGDPFANGNRGNGNGFPSLPGGDPFANGNRGNGNGSGNNDSYSNQNNNFPFRGRLGR